MSFLTYVTLRLSCDAPDGLTGAAGVYVLYDDGEDVRLLNTLYLRDPEACGHPTNYTTWDSVMNVDHDVKVIADQPSHFQIPYNIFQCLYGYTSAVI